MQARIQDHWMTEGVTIVDPRNTYIDGRASIGADTVIHPFTVINGTVKVGAGCQVGPHAHLRDGTVLGDRVEVGVAFVEIKQSHPSGTARSCATWPISEIPLSAKMPTSVQQSSPPIMMVFGKTQRASAPEPAHAPGRHLGRAP